MGPVSPRAPHAAAVLAVLAAAALLPACGGGNPGKFRSQYTGDQRQVRVFGNEVARTFASAREVGDVEVVPQLERLTARAKALDRRLAALAPPDSARPRLARLRAALDALRGDLVRVVEAIHSYSPGDWLNATSQTAADLRTMRNAADELPGEG